MEDQHANSVACEAAVDNLIDIVESGGHLQSSDATNFICVLRFPHTVAIALHAHAVGRVGSNATNCARDNAKCDMEIMMLEIPGAQIEFRSSNRYDQLQRMIRYACSLPEHTDAFIGRLFAIMNTNSPELSAEVIMSCMNQDHEFMRFARAGVA